MVAVYVEMNFVLELALGQDQARAAEAITNLAEQESCSLILPSIALSESFSNIGYRNVERERVYGLLQQLQELNRSIAHQQIVKNFRAVLPTLTQIRKTETDSLERVLGRLFNFVRIIELTATSFQQAIAYEATFSLLPQDAIVFASVISDLKTQSPQAEKCFISRNTRDFNRAPIKEELGLYNCRYIASFEDGLSFITNRTRNK